MRIPSNKVCDIERFAYSELEEIYNRNEIRTLLQILFEHFLGWSVAHFLISKNKTLFHGIKIFLVISKFKDRYFFISKIIMKVKSTHSDRIV